MQTEQDIHSVIQPAEVSYWPLQPGWYIVFGIILIVLLFVVRNRYQRWLKNAFKRQAITQVKALENDLNFFFKLNTVLKSVAMQTWGRNRVAELSGKAWSEFLRSSKKTTPFTTKILAELEQSNYKNRNEAYDVVLIKDAKTQSINWIRSASRKTVKNY